MKLRLLEIEKDFSVIKNWITDEKSHAMWCADLMHYPLEITNFKEVLFEAAERFGDIPYVAVTDEGDVVGFYSYSYNKETNEGMFKFVVVDPEYRGKGIAGNMLRLAISNAFMNPEIKLVHLNVFPENIQAKKCYEKIGFVERNTTPNAFAFKSELWGKCNMIIQKWNYNFYD